MRGLSHPTRAARVPTQGQSYFLGRDANALLQRLQRFRCGFTLAPHFGQRSAFSF
jgi:hypothetical protein